MHMDRRQRKQLIYGSSFISFWLVIFLAVYFAFVKPDATCFDGWQNQGEEGVDCGGPCSAVCIPSVLHPVELVNAPLVFYPEGGGTSIMIQIQNKNDVWAAKKFNYTLSIYNTNDENLKTITGTSFIYASQFKYLLFPNLALERGVGRIEFRATDEEWVKAETLPPPNVSVQRATTKIQDNFLVAEGQLSNKESATFSGVVVIAIFHGQFGQIAGVSQTIIDGLMPGETRSFNVVHPPIDGVNFSGTEIIVSTPRS